MLTLLHKMYIKRITALECISISLYRCCEMCLLIEQTVRHANISKPGLMDTKLYIVSFFFPSLICPFGSTNPLTAHLLHRHGNRVNTTVQSLTQFLSFRSRHEGGGVPVPSNSLTLLFSTHLPCPAFTKPSQPSTSTSHEELTKDKPSRGQLLSPPTMDQSQNILVHQHSSVLYTVLFNPMRDLRPPPPVYLVHVPAISDLSFVFILVRKRNVAFRNS